MNDQPRPTALAIPDLKDSRPRDFSEVMKQQEDTMKSMFSFEQWCWICWLEVHGNGKHRS